MADFRDGLERQGWQSLAARLDERTRYFWAIDSISNAIGSALNTEELMRVALEHTVEATGASGGVLYTPQSDGSWKLAAWQNVPDEIAAEVLYVGADAPPVKALLESQGPAVCQVLAEGPTDMLLAVARDHGIQSWAGVVVRGWDRAWALLAVYSYGREAFNQAHSEVLRVISQLVGLALTNAIAHENTLAQASSQLQSRLIEMETVLGSMSDGILICNSEGKVVKANLSACRLLGTLPEKLIGQSLLEERWNRSPKGDGEQYRPGEGPLSAALMHGEECSNCPIEVTVGEQQRVLSMTVSPLRKLGGSGDDGAVAVIRDITQEREMERMKDDFLSILSHELRTPLTVISGYAQLLVRKLTRRDLQEEAGFAGQIEDHITRLASIVGDLVDSTRLEMGEQALEAELADMSALTEEVVGRIRADQRYSDKHHSVLLSVEDGLPHVMCDRRRIDQVLTNLLSNAIRYSPDGGKIEVSVGQVAGKSEGAKTILVSVTDEGIGVPPEERELVFERAFRGKRSNSISVQGLGLGLYICKLIIEARGGEIGIEEGPVGVGSRFWFTLPVSDQ